MIAIQLTTTGQWLDMLPDSSLRYEMVSGAFDMEAIQANVVYPFDFPVAGNEEKLNHAHVIAVNRTTKVYDVGVYVGGMLLFTGRMHVKKVSNTTFSASIIENGIVSGFSETDLGDMGWTPITMPVGGTGMADYAAYCCEESWPDVPVNFPVIKAPNCYGEANADNANFAGYINNYERTTGYYYFNEIATEDDPFNQNSMMPMVYLFEIFAQIERHFGLRFTGNIMSNADYKKIIVNALRLADAGSNKYLSKLFIEAPTGDIYWTDPPGSINTRWLALIEEEDTDNCWNGYFYNIKSVGYHTIKCSFVADWDVWNPGADHLHLFIGKDVQNVDVGYYIDSATDGHSEFTYECTFWASAADIGENLYFNMYVERGTTPYNIDSVTGTVEISNTTTSGLNVFDSILNIPDYLPEITAAEFLNRMRTLLGGAVFIDNQRRVIELSDYDSILNSEALDLTDCAVDGEFELELLDEESYAFRWEWGGDDRAELNIGDYTELDSVTTRSQLSAASNFGKICQVQNEKNFLLQYYNGGAPAWKHLMDVFYNKTIGEGKTEVNPNCSPIRMLFDTNAIVPQIEVAPLSNLYGSGSLSSVFRMLTYFGMQQDSDGKSYPLGSSGSYDTEGNSLGNVELDWNGNKGFYERCWKNWVQFCQSQESMTQQLRVDLPTFLQIRNLFLPQDNTKKTRQIRIANINYIPEKISVIFTDADTWECEAILRKKGAIDL